MSRLDPKHKKRNRKQRPTSKRQCRLISIKIPRRRMQAHRTALKRVAEKRRDRNRQEDNEIEARLHQLGFVD